MNPYADQLGGREPLQVMTETWQRAREVARRLGDPGMELSLSRGKWTAAQILAHLADCEMAFGFRLRQILAEHEHQVQPFDQSAWAWPYTRLQGKEALEAWLAMRRWNLLWLAQVGPEQYERNAFHPERGQMTFRDALEMIAGHDRHHLAQLETLAGQR